MNDTKRIVTLDDGRYVEMDDDGWCYFYHDDGERIRSLDMDYMEGHLARELAAMTARFDEEETNKLRAIGLYDSCKKDLDAATERAERAEAKFKEARRTDPVVRLNNLCAALEEQKADSPYSAEAWDQITQENNELRKRVKDAERRAEENTRDAERYRWATENVLRFSPELRPERKPISCPDKLVGCMVAHFAPIEKSDIDKVIDDARNEEDKA